MRFNEIWISTTCGCSDPVNSVASARRKWDVVGSALLIYLLFYVSQIKKPSAFDCEFRSGTPCVLKVLSRLMGSVSRLFCLLVKCALDFKGRQCNVDVTVLTRMERLRFILRFCDNIKY